MVREIITLSIGECGVRFGSKIWETYTAEHHLNSDGTTNNSQIESNGMNLFFSKSNDERYTANSILCDSSLYNTDCHDSIHDIVQPKEDSSSLFSRGYLTIGRECIDTLQYRLRKMMDNCDNPQGFIINHSITGGTSSGLTALILERIAVDYRRKSRFGIEVSPFITRNDTDSIVDPYNMALSMHNLIDHTDLSIMFDNEALYNQCRNKLNVHYPSYDNLNELIVKTVTHFTQKLRFGEFESHDTAETISNLVPFPRLHFLTPSVSVIIPKYNPFTLINGYVRTAMDRETIYRDIMSLLYKSYDVDIVKTGAVDLTENAFNSSNFLIDYGDFNAVDDKYLGGSVHYRSTNGINYKNAYHILGGARDKGYMSMVDWVPNSIKYSVVDPNEIGHNVANEGNGLLSETDGSAVMTGNNTAFGGWFDRRIINTFNAMFDRRAYVHWYYNEGMEEDLFLETRQDLEYLRQDYRDVLEEQETDEDDEEEDLGYNRNDYVISTMSEQQMIDKALNDSLDDWKRNASNHLS